MLEKMKVRHPLEYFGFDCQFKILCSSGRWGCITEQDLFVQNQQNRCKGNKTATKQKIWFQFKILSSLFYNNWLEANSCKTIMKFKYWFCMTRNIHVLLYYNFIKLVDTTECHNKLCCLQWPQVIPMVLRRPLWPAHPERVLCNCSPADFHSTIIVRPNRNQTRWYQFCENINLSVRILWSTTVRTIPSFSEVGLPSYGAPKRS
jgi:hypothetical protein